MLRTSNPALKEATFRGLPRAVAGEAMTLQGTVNKTGISLLILLASAAFVWNSRGLPAVHLHRPHRRPRRRPRHHLQEHPRPPTPRPLYALFEGLLLGGISQMFEMRYEGIVINAVALTFGTLAALLAAYSTGLIRPARTSSSASLPPPAASPCCTWCRWCSGSSASASPTSTTAAPSASPSACSW